MTELLQRAFDEASKLSDSEQDALATRLLEELADEAAWDRSFEGSSSGLATLAEEAREEYRRGETEVLDPDAF